MLLFLHAQKELPNRECIMFLQIQKSEKQWTINKTLL